MISFNEFLEAYYAACSSFEVAPIEAAVWENYVGEYFYPGGVTRTFDKPALIEAWQAASGYIAAGARLEYSNIAIAQRENERIVVSWVSMPVKGQPTGNSLLTSTFALTTDGWKLTRENMQHRVERI